MKKHISVLFVLSFCAVQADNKSINLEDVMVAAYFNNKEWAANKTDKRLADEKYKMSQTMFLPDVNAYMNTSRTKKNVDTNYNNLVKISDSELNTGTNMGIRVHQNLFNGFSTLNSMEASKFGSDAAFHKLRENEQKLIVKVLGAYTDVWFGVRRVDALKKKEENLRKTLLSQQTSLEAGIITSSEVASANADYHKSVFERISAETELFSAESEFEKLTGLKASKNIELPVLELDLPDSLDKLVDQALSSNSSILSAKFVEQSALKELAATRGKLSPSCDVSLQTIRGLSKDKTVNRASNNYIGTLEVNVPILANSNGSTYSQIEIANQQALKAKFNAEDTVLEIKKECVKNWNIYIATDAMIKSAKTAVECEELNSDSNLEATALGMKSNTDIWVRENKLLDSRIGLADSQRRKILASVNLLMLSGNLSIHSLLNKIKKPPKSKNKKTIKGNYV